MSDEWRREPAASAIRGSAVSGPNGADETPYVARIKNRVEDLSEDVLTLTQQYLELARVELREELKELVEASAWTAASLGVLAAGALTLVAAAVLALALVIPAWASALVVGFSIIALGLAMGAVAKREAGDVDGKPSREPERGLPAPSVPGGTT